MRSLAFSLCLAFTLATSAYAQVVPVADAGPDVTVPCSSPDGATVELHAVADPNSPEAPNLTYAWSAPGVEFSPPDGVNTVAVFPVGTTVVTLTVTFTDPDTAEQTQAQDEVTVTVGDNTPPMISACADPDLLWPPNHKLVPVHVGVTAFDVCDTQPDVQLLSITNSQADNGNGSGNTSDDIQGAEPGTDDVDFLLRAERSGQDKSGRTYRATYRATDGSGNFSDAVATVFVPHDRGHDGVAEGCGDSSSSLPKEIKQAQKATKKLSKQELKLAKKNAKLANKAFKAAVRAAH